MGNNWYNDWEDEHDEINQSFGRDFVQGHLKEQQSVVKNSIVAKLYTHQSGQISFFEEKPHLRVGSTRGVEYVLLSKRDEPVKVRQYIEEYIPENEND